MSTKIKRDSILTGDDKLDKHLEVGPDPHGVDVPPEPAIRKSARQARSRPRRRTR